jgi:hypothetical protein
MRWAARDNDFDLTGRNLMPGGSFTPHFYTLQTQALRQRSQE